MTLFVNGEPATLASRLTVAEMLEVMGFPVKGVAVERNREIVPRSQYGEVRLLEGDRIEVVECVGGG